MKSWIRAVGRKARRTIQPVWANVRGTTRNRERRALLLRLKARRSVLILCYFIYLFSMNDTILYITAAISDSIHTLIITLSSLNICEE